jgi:maltose phosphorylase
MSKFALNYYKNTNNSIKEIGFNREYNELGESIFSLSNEYMGVRASFEEGSTLKSLVGTYFNGIYENSRNLNLSHYKGISRNGHYMVNSVNFFYVRIFFQDEILDLGTITFDDFSRELDLDSGLLKREFTWITKKGPKIRISFERLLSFEFSNFSFQNITFKSDEKVTLRVILGLDFGILHFNSFNDWTINYNSLFERTLIGTTKTSSKVGVMYEANLKGTLEFRDKILTEEIFIDLEQNKEKKIERKIVTYVVKEKNTESLDLINEKLSKLNESCVNFNSSLLGNKKHFKDFYEKCGITIEGDITNNIGIKYSLFQLESCYHGLDSLNNIGAKGLTGEAYSGHTFWDTETYCLPFFIFTNSIAAKNLLLYRYNHLSEAKDRAKELDCLGACFPIATLNGKEACDLWQHASTQVQPTSGVCYATLHYFNVTNDILFIKEYGLEMLIECIRFLVSRGDFNIDRTKFGLFGVMGPDEFELMVSHDMYTNYVIKEVIKDTLNLIDSFKNTDPSFVNDFKVRLNIAPEELDLFQEVVDKMVILYNPKTLLYEQHLGYYELPHIDIKKIKVSDFPLYNNWSYDRIYRNDMIKQPDVLMAMFLYNSNFSLKEKKANYDFYEKRTIHESSLSPSIHSIIALELDYEKDAYSFFNFATRMDLDDYNRNSNEGLHMTSIAASWLNIVYGFGGLRSDSKILSLNPKLPKEWESYSFGIIYRNVNLKFHINKVKLLVEANHDLEVPIKIYNKEYKIFKGDLIIEFNKNN